MAPGSNLHLMLAIEQKLCAERLLGALGEPSSSSSSSSSDEGGGGGSDGEGEVVAWMQEGLARADAAALDALFLRWVSRRVGSCT